MKRFFLVCGSTLLMILLIVVGVWNQTPTQAESIEVIPQPWNGARYALVNDQGQAFSFPRSAHGKITIVGFIYTHCPGICRTLTLRMQDIAHATQGDSSLQLLCVSFDPRRDTSKTLAEYRSAFGVTDQRWQFLTGAKNVIDSLCRVAEVLHTESYSTRLPSGEEQYFINHSDVVLLLDGHGNVRKRFDDASAVESEEYVKAIRALQKELIP